MNIIAIDPGQTGAVAFYAYRLNAWSVYDCPTLEVKGKPVSDPGLMSNLIQNLVTAETVAFVEKVHSMPKQGVSSTFKFGRNYGIWLGILAALQISMTLVTPQAWTKVMLAGMPKGKQAGRIRALQLFPYLVDDLKLKKNDGRGDALCIGEYGRRLLGGNH